MIDWFVLAAPVFLLGVIALAGFVGCAELADIEDWSPQGPPTEKGPPEPPGNAHSSSGDGVVTLLWDPVAHALYYDIYREISPPGVPPASYTHLETVTPAALPTVNGFLAYEDHDVTNGVTYHYVITVTTEGGTSVDSPDIEATPESAYGPFITDFVPGTIRAGEDGWFGFSFVAVVPLTVQKLGRFYGPSNGGTHDLDLIDATTLQILGKATVDLTSEVDVAGFRYAEVTPSPVQLNQDSEYYLLSLETLGGDDFLTQDTTVTTNAEAAITNAVDSTALVVFTPAGGPDHAYGPVNFQY